MTQPVVVEVRQKDSTVDLVAPELAAIQHRYEEARASIAGLAGGSRDAAEDLAEPYPETQAIDVRLAKPPTAHSTTPPTTGMTVAARCLAEQPEGESCPETQAPHRHADRAPAPPRHGGWWRAIRITLPRAVPVSR
jgi:hypothetical protein